MPNSKPQPQVSEHDDEKSIVFWIVFWTIVGLFAVLVFGIWFVGTYYPDVFRLPTAAKPDASLDGRGNAVAALFSGFAFVGVVAAIILQSMELMLQRRELRETKEAMQQSASAQDQQTAELREQTAELRKQVAAQEAALLSDTKSRQSQSREQFLTARLNATVALLQACQADADVSQTPRGALRHGYQLREIRSLQQQIAILRCEARLGFDGGPWTSTFELWAIRLYLIDLFQDLQNRYLLAPGETEFDVGGAFNHASRVRDDLVLLSERFRHRGDAIAAVLQHVVAETPTPKEGVEPMMEKTVIQKWVTRHLHGTLNRSQSVWELNLPGTLTRDPRYTVADD